MPYLRLHSDPKLRGSQAERSREISSTRYGWERQGEELVDDVSRQLVES